MSDKPQGQDKAVQSVITGLYVHVPFCARTCDFCAFYQEAPDAASIRRYLEGIELESSLVTWPARIETIFWGGGTPGLLSARDLLALGHLCKRPGEAPSEWSVEMTPVSVTDARLDALKQLGINRISLGVQSFQPRLLEALGRDHKPEQARRAFDRLRKAGFENINLDLMFAMPGQTEEEWKRDLDEAIGMAPEHLSTYCLTFEEDTRLWLKLSKGVVRRDIEAEARLYTRTWDVLEQVGYHQYEISNFAKPGRECLHNQNTWRMQDWIGLGPSAASQQKNTRGTNVADLDAWLDHLSRGKRATEDIRQLSDAGLAEDALVFGLRMNAGLDLALWKARVNTPSWNKVENCLTLLQENGLVLRSGSWIRLSDKGRLLADSVGTELLGLLE